MSNPLAGVADIMGELAARMTPPAPPRPNRATRRALQYGRQPRLERARLDQDRRAKREATP